MALVKAAYRASEVNYDPPTRATWDQIVSSGHIGLLPRGAAGQLAEYFAFDFARGLNDLLVDSGYRKQVRRLFPRRVQEAIREGCSDIRSETALIVGFVPECVIDVDGAALQETADLLQSDPDLLSLLNWHYSHAWSAAINSTGIAIQISQALDALGAEKMVSEAKVVLDLYSRRSATRGRSATSGWHGQLNQTVYRTGASPIRASRSSRCLTSRAARRKYPRNVFFR